MKALLLEILGTVAPTGELRIVELCSGVGVIGLSLAHAAAQA